MNKSEIDAGSKCLQSETSTTVTLSHTHTNIRASILNEMHEQAYTEDFKHLRYVIRIIISILMVNITITIMPI